MDENRKNGYRYLVYWGLIEIRAVTWIRFHWWNQFSTSRHIRHAQLVGDLANALHNLGHFASFDFEGFDEERFWQDLERVKERFPEFEFEKYRWLFDRRLDELESNSR